MMKMVVHVVFNGFLLKVMYCFISGPPGKRGRMGRRGDPGELKILLKFSGASVVLL